MTRRAKILTASSLLLAAAMAAIIVFVVIPHLRKPLDVAIDRTAYPVKGIDVSHHNGHIDYCKVRNDTVDFVIIKATDGIGDTDPMMLDNYKGAMQADLDIGVYHFFRYHRDGTAQARYFMSVIDTLRLDLPVVIDLEDTDNESGHEQNITSRLRDMVDELHNAGYRVMIYANHNQYDTYVRNRFDDVDIWLASSRPPGTDDPRALWQHSHCGRVNGIDGDVDLNTFNGSRDRYNAWTSQPARDTARANQSQNNNQPQS